MVRLKNNRVWKIGPRSAHIAGLKYSCFADPDILKTGKVVMIKPKPNDQEEYVAIQCGEEKYAITNTCAANVLNMIEKADYAYANRESAKIAIDILAKHLGISSFEVANSIIQTSSFEITKEIGKILTEFKMERTKTKIIGGGGGASVLVPFIAKQLSIPYQKAQHAEVISSIGVASSMIQEELEQTITNPSSEKISYAHKKIHSIMVDKGAMPESIVINSEYIPDKSILRVTAIGNVVLDSTDSTKNIFTLDEAKRRTSEIIEISEDLVELSFETDHYFVFTGHIEIKRLLSTKNRHHIVVLDRYGRLKLSVKNGKIFQGGKISIIEELDEFLESRKNDIAPKVYLLHDLKLVDYSSLTSSAQILNAVKQELEGFEKAAVIVEL